MTDTKETTGTWRNWLLIGSLALNLAFIGLIAGASLRDKPSERGRPSTPDMLRELVRAVPHRAELRENRGQLLTILDSSEFDISSVVTIFETQRVILSRGTRGGHEIIIRRIEAMSDEDRQMFAQNIRNFQERNSRRKSQN